MTTIIEKLVARLKGPEKLLDEFLAGFDINLQTDYIALKKSLCKLCVHLPEDKWRTLNARVIANIPKGEALMKSIAQDFKDEGIAQGIVQEKITIATKMLQANSDRQFIADMTDLSIAEIHKLASDCKFTIEEI